MPEPSARRIIKKKVAGHGHHGGAWKVAYADFVTAMMALFMVMWLLASTDAASRKEISNYFRTGLLPIGDLAMGTAAQTTPSVVEVSAYPPEPGTESIHDTPAGAMASKIKSKLDKLASYDDQLAKVMKNVKIMVKEDGLVIEAVDNDGMLFEVASANLKEPLERFLRALAPLVSMTGAPVELYGHTDARPFAKGSTMSNWDLSYARAAAARGILEDAGVPAKMITGVIARGATELHVPNDPLAAANRRLSVKLTIARPADTKVAAVPPIVPPPAQPAVTAPAAPAHH